MPCHSTFASAASVNHVLKSLWSCHALNLDSVYVDATPVGFHMKLYTVSTPHGSGPVTAGESATSGSATGHVKCSQCSVVSHNACTNALRARTARGSREGRMPRGGSALHFLKRYCRICETALSVLLIVTWLHSIMSRG